MPVSAFLLVLIRGYEMLLRQMGRIELIYKCTGLYNCVVVGHYLGKVIITTVIQGYVSMRIIFIVI